MALFHYLAPKLLVPGQRSPQGNDLAGLGHRITGHVGDQLPEIRRFQGLDDRLDKRRIQILLATNHEVVLPQHRHKTKPELLGRRTQTKAAIGHARRNGCRYGKVRRLFGLVTDNFVLLDPIETQQLVEQYPRTRARLAIDEVDVRPHQIENVVQTERIARRNDQALLAGRHANQFVIAEAQLPPQLRMHPRTSLAQMRQIDGEVNTSHQTGARIELLQGANALHIIDIQQQAALLHQLLAQSAEQQVMAGRDAQWHQRRTHREPQLVVQFVGHVFGRRGHPGQHPSLRPEQAFAKIRQAG